MPFRPMSNRGPALFVLIGCSAAWAQSPGLLEAVRVNRTDVRQQANTELQTCLSLSPPCPEADQLSLLAGFLALSESDAAAAVDTLTARKPPKGLEAFHGWYLAEAYSWSARPAQALSALKGARVRAPAWLQRRIDARAGELWLQQGKPAKALPLLEAATAVTVTPELLFARAFARLRSGDKSRGRADLKTILVRYPLHPHAETAQQVLTATAPVAFTLEERLARVNAFLAAGSGAKAMREIDDAAAPASATPLTAARLELTRAVALFAAGDESNASAALSRALAGPAPVAAEALMLQARRAMRAGDNRLGQQLLQTLTQKYPLEVGADEAAYLAAWLSLQSGDLADAVNGFVAFEQQHPNAKKLDEARWFRGFALYRAGQLERAREVLLSLLIDYPRSSLVPQARYWAARARHRAQGEPMADAGSRLPRIADGGVVVPIDGGAVDAGVPKAGPSVADEYRQVVAAYPGTFYALLASTRVQQLGEAAPVIFADAPRELKVQMPPALQLAQLLSRAGLYRDAAEESQRVLSTVTGATAALQYGHAFQRVGEFGAAHSLAARWLWGAAYGAKEPEALALMYPRAFDESVEKWSERHGLDPFIAWAIMRRESAFRPDVISAADARGLMQIIPPTARGIASELKLEAPSPDDLFSVDVNISFGTWYLAALLKRFGHPSLMAAAYNAGPTPVVKWATLKATLELDEWVEEIPFKETRGYVKQVTADYFIYRSLYAQSAPPASLALRFPTPGAAGVSF